MVLQKSSKSLAGSVWRAGVDLESLAPWRGNFDTIELENLKRPLQRYLFFPFCSRSIPIKTREDARHLDLLTHMHACMHLEKVSASAAMYLTCMGLAVTHKINRKYVRDSAHGYIIIHYMDDDDVGGGVERLPI